MPSNSSEHTPREVQGALDRVLRGTPATAVVLAVHDGSILAKSGAEQAATPGSVIKPLLLSWGLHHGTVRTDTAVYCRRKLRVGEQRLPCTHPPDQTTFTAQAALAESCNTYFAALGLRMRGNELESALLSTGLPHTDAAKDTAEQRELTALGLYGVSATPMRLARAYRSLMMQEAAGGPVLQGMADSVRFGMANQAHVDGMEILGKTGTASEHAGGPTHGWFAGGLPGSLVIVLYVPLGSGGEAALLAGSFFRAMSERQK